MPQPFTVVTLKDADGDEFPVRLPGIYRGNRDADIEAAQSIIRHDSESKPRGALSFVEIDYIGERQ